MLLNDADACTRMSECNVEPYFDPKLKYDRKSYVEFITELTERGLLRWRKAVTGERHTLGVFFVAKKDGKLRLIFDTRVANLQFCAPPATALPTAAAFASVDIEADANINRTSTGGT